MLGIPHKKLVQARRILIFGGKNYQFGFLIDTRHFATNPSLVAN